MCLGRERGVNVWLGCHPEATGGTAAEEGVIEGRMMKYWQLFSNG